MHRDGNTCHHSPDAKQKTWSCVLPATQAQRECRHRLLLTVRLLNPSVSGHDWGEPMEWDLIWCQTKHLDEAACMDLALVYLCVRALDSAPQLMVFMCVLVRAHTQSQVWVTVTGRNGKTGRWAGFKDGARKSVRVVTNQKDGCDVTSHPYAIAAFRTHSKVEKQDLLSAGHKFNVSLTDMTVRITQGHRQEMHESAAGRQDQETRKTLDKTNKLTKNGGKIQPWIHREWLTNKPQVYTEKKCGELFLTK